MAYDDQLTFRVNGTQVDNIEGISDRTGLDKSEVSRRLLKLGLQDVEEIGDEVLFGVDVDPATPEANAD